MPPFFLLKITVIIVLLLKFLRWRSIHFSVWRRGVGVGVGFEEEFEHQTSQSWAMLVSIPERVTVSWRIPRKKDVSSWETRYMIYTWTAVPDTTFSRHEWTWPTWRFIESMCVSTQEGWSSPIPIPEMLGEPGWEGTGRYEGVLNLWPHLLGVSGCTLTMPQIWMTYP
jgi:hypothetical protein